MSRIGKNPVVVPKEVKVSITDGNIHLEGPKGKLDLKIPFGIRVESKEAKLIVSRMGESKQDRSNHGTIRARLASMMIGLTQGHRKDLEIQGLGFRAQLQGKNIVFNLGLSHPVEFPIPTEVKVTVPTQTAISVEGPSSELVGQVAADIRSLQPVEPYKGKGIRYVGEFVRRKQGKSVTK